MRSAAALVLAAVLYGASLTAAPPRQPADEGALVEIDAVVVDGKGRAVHGLTMQDFSVREDGKPMTLATFREVRGPAPDDPDSARSIVLLLDDSGVSATGTQAVQAIARAVISSATDLDDLSVVRLHVRGDEPFGDRLAGESRIGEYRGGASPFAYWSTARDVLERIANIAPLVASNASPRRLIVCIGSPEICNLPEPMSTSPPLFELAWNAAIAATARANVAVYALIPGRASLGVDRLTDYTGGEEFASSYDFGPSIDRILQDASNYYVLGYWPAASTRSMHRIQVKVNARGAKVHARKAR
jgi:hypothetical protein